MIYSFDYGATQIAVNITFSQRKRLSITVHPNLQITAKAPDDIPQEQIKERLKKRGPWIARQLDYFEQYQPIMPPREYVGGETHYYLGRQYRLKLIQHAEQKVRLLGRFFEIYLPDTYNKQRVKSLLWQWYRDHLNKILDAFIKKHQKSFTKLGISKPDFHLRLMKKRWGSCSRKSTILFNPELVKAPGHCIEYVVVHELCHLVHPHHNPKFYNLLTYILPDWESRKKRLEKVQI